MIDLTHMETKCVTP